MNFVAGTVWSWTNDTRGTRAVPLGLGLCFTDYPGQRQGSWNSPCLTLGFDRVVPSGHSPALRGTLGCDPPNPRQPTKSRRDVPIKAQGKSTRAKRAATQPWVAIHRTHANQPSPAGTSPSKPRVSQREQGERRRSPGSRSTEPTPTNQVPQGRPHQSPGQVNASKASGDAALGHDPPNPRQPTKSRRDVPIKAQGKSTRARRAATQTQPWVAIHRTHANQPSPAGTSPSKPRASQREQGERRRRRSPGSRSTEPTPTNQVPQGRPHQSPGSVDASKASGDAALGRDPSNPRQPTKSRRDVPIKAQGKSTRAKRAATQPWVAIHRTHANQPSPAGTSPSKPRVSRREQRERRRSPGSRSTEPTPTSQVPQGRPHQSPG